MIDDTDALLNDLLARWHLWCTSKPPAIGYPSEAAGCRLYRASRQHDSENGALDTDSEAETLAIVDFCIEQVDQPYRTALMFNARNLATGLSVWTSPRLPIADVERAAMVVEARGMLLILLRQGGVA